MQHFIDIAISDHVLDEEIISERLRVPTPSPLIKECYISSTFDSVLDEGDNVTVYVSSSRWERQ